MTALTHRQVTDTPPIVPRRVKFDLSLVPKYWHSGSPFLTYFFTALSISFPEGEKFFMDAVRHYRDELEDEKTRAEVDAFIRQEAQHSHQHRVLNDFVAKHGVDTAWHDAMLAKVLGVARRFLPPETQLGITIALEHFTSTLANQFLTNPAFSDGMHEDIRPLWLWHAMEETEHKAVCFDAFEQAGCTYGVRARSMARVMFGFPMGMTFLTLVLMLSDRKFNPLDIARGLRFLWGRGGFFRSIIPEVRAYFRRDFHPWDCDNRELISDWTAEYGDYVLNP